MANLINENEGECFVNVTSFNGSIVKYTTSPILKYVYP